MALYNHRGEERMREETSRPRARLVRQLTVFGIVPVILLVAGLVGYSSFVTFDREQGSAETNLQNLAERVALEIERSNTRAVLAARVMAYAQVNGMFGRREESVAYARQVLETMPEFTGAYFGYEPNADQNDAAFIRSNAARSITAAMTDAGRFIPYWFRDHNDRQVVKLEPLVDMETSLYYQGNKDQFLESGALPMVTEPYVYEGKLIVEQTFPIVIDGEFKGIAGIDRALDDIDAFITEISQREGVDVFLISRSGRFIAATTEEENLIQTRAIEDTEYTEILGPMFADNARRSLKLANDPFTNESHYFVTSPIPTGTWQAVVRAREAAITGPIWNDVIREVTIGGVALSILGALALWFVSGLSRRVRHAVSSANQISRGEIPKTTLSADAGNDEIGQLARSFDHVVAFYRDIERTCVAIASGDFSKKITPRGETDQLSVAINEMADRREAAEAEMHRLSEEAAQEAKFEAALGELAARIKGDLDVKSVAENALSFIVEFMSLQIGAIFAKSRQDDPGNLWRIASWAYPDDGVNREKVRPGEGLVGQVADSGKLLITESESEGVNLQFGFADISPQQVLHIPLLHDDQVLGVMELASVTKLSSDQINWLSKAADTTTISIQFALGRAALQTAFAESRAERERAQTILDSSPDPILIVGRNSVIDYVNQQVSTVLGYAPSDLIGQEVEKLIPERFQGGHGQLIDSFFNDANARTMASGRELRAMTADGREMPVDISLSPIEIGGETMVAASLRDVTKRKEAEDKLWESQQLLEGVIENSAAVCYAKDKDGKYLLVNKVWQEVTGCPRDKAIGFTDLEIYATEEVARELQKNDQQVMSAGGAVEFEEMVPKDGEERIYLSTKFPLFDGDGNVTGICGMSTDITDRKHAEQTLQAAKSAAEKAAQELQKTTDNQRAILDSLESSVMVTSPEGTIIYANPKAATLVEDTRENLIGKNAANLYQDPKVREELIALLKRDGAVKEFEISVKSKSGKTLWILTSMTPIEFEGRSAFLSNHYDITERRQMEEDLRDAKQAAESATKAKGDFLASMSHEIRTPMNGITGMADLLTQTELNDEQSHMLRTIRESGNALITVINDILDFSKIEAGRMDLEDVSMSVADALEGVAGTLTPNATKKGVRIHTFVDPEIPQAVHGDPVRLRQILFNLTGNAVKFSDKKDVMVSARPLARGDDDRLWCRFEIVDQGIGISKENQAKLFQAFSQAESSTTRKFGGTGLGLAICKRLVELMNGAVGVESEEGKGSTFWVEVPFKAAAGSRITEKQRDLQGVRVLLVGSEKPRQSALTTYLDHWGADFALAKSETETAKMLAAAVKEKNAFDAVVIDCDLANERQEAAVEQIRAAQKKKKVPMILLQDYQKRGARIQSEDVVTLDANPLIRYRFVTAVAVAVGRASPEVKKDEDVLKVKKGKAPTVEEALAQGQLILLAEDNPTNQDVIRRQLNLLGYTCEIANDGAQALKAWDTGRYVMLLTDCHMPEMDGYELTGAIREREQGSKTRAPIVAITANALQGEAERCLAAGMDDYLSKPVAMPALNRALAKWMPESGGGSAQNGAGGSKGASSAKGKTKTKVKKAAAKKTAAKQASADIPPVNDRTIKDMFGDDDETFREILQGFIEPTEEIIQDIASALEKRNAEDIKGAAHKLKSSARSIGADVLADTSLALETAGKEQNWETIENLAPSVKPLFDAVKKYVEAL